MLSLQLYTCIQPSSVPNHMVDCCSSDDACWSDRFIGVGKRFSGKSFSESLELLESSMLSEHLSDFFRLALEHVDGCRVVVSSIDMLTKLADVELKFRFVDKKKNTASGKAEFSGLPFNVRGNRSDAQYPRIAYTVAGHDRRFGEQTKDTHLTHIAIAVANPHILLTAQRGSSTSELETSSGLANRYTGYEFRYGVLFQWRNCKWIHWQLLSLSLLLSAKKMVT